MKYKLINYRPNHSDMVKMVGKSLYTILDNEIVKIRIVSIGCEGKKLVWVFEDEKGFKENQPIFKNEWSASHYLIRTNKKKLKGLYL